MATGEDVAIKVQRPGLLQRIALDIFILRNCAKFVRRWKRTNSNLPALIDDWASSIYREMSYVNELQNAETFKELFAHYTEVRLVMPVSDRSQDAPCFIAQRPTCVFATQVRAQNGVAVSLVVTPCMPISAPAKYSIPTSHSRPKLTILRV